MKVCLFAVNGSWSHSNLAIRCLRNPLEKVGLCVELIECTLRDPTEFMLEKLWVSNADIYGFSCYIWNIDIMLEVASNLHSIRPNAKIILGGPEVSFDTERFSSLPFISAIVCGEGENALPALCEKISEGKPFQRIVVDNTGYSDFADTGIHYRDGEETGGILYYESSRGCPFNCSYCLSSATKGVRFKSAAKTLADLEEFEKLHANCKIIKFVDRTFNADAKRANEIWQGLLDEKFTKHYHFEICASLLNEDSFSVLSKFPKGKIQLEVGLQSTFTETLSAVARHIDPEKVISAVRRIHDFSNIHVHLDLIAGLPYESYERFGKSFNDCYGCCDKLQLGFLKLLHGTTLRQNSGKYGYIFEKKAPYTVLGNSWISYPELNRLHRIADTLERYDESGNFAHTLWYLLPFSESPFSFWEALTGYIEKRDSRPLRKISQPDAYRYLMEFAISEFTGCNENTLRSFLCTDFKACENKNPPAFLR